MIIRSHNGLRSPSPLFFPVVGSRFRQLRDWSKIEMSLTPSSVNVYHVFLASPGDVNAERQHVRRFFDDDNRSTARISPE